MRSCTFATFFKNLSFFILTALLLISISPITTVASQSGFNQSGSRDLFSVPEKTVNKSAHGIDYDKYEIVVDSNTINQSLLSEKGAIDLNIEFTSGSTKLTRTARKQIEQICIALKSEKLTGKKILIVGHTDNSGSSIANQKLSEKRAQRVKEALQSAGIAKERLKSTGQGENKPIADNHTAAGRARNRRVTLSRID